MSSRLINLFCFFRQPCSEAFLGCLLEAEGRECFPADCIGCMNPMLVTQGSPEFKFSISGGVSNHAQNCGGNPMARATHVRVTLTTVLRFLRDASVSCNRQQPCPELCWQSHGTHNTSVSDSHYLKLWLTQAFFVTTPKVENLNSAEAVQ